MVHQKLKSGQSKYNGMGLWDSLVMKYFLRPKISVVDLVQLWYKVILGISLYSATKSIEITEPTLSYYYSLARPP